MAHPYLELLSEIIDNLEQPLISEVSLECKHFFSGAALYANGIICASYSPAGFALKLPAEEQKQLMDQGEGKELRYFKNAPVKKEYVVLSDVVIEDKSRLKSLICLSINHTLDFMSTD